MANLTSVNINGALIRKEGTGSSSTVDLSNAPFDGASAIEFADQIYHGQYQLAHDPHTPGRFVVAYHNENDSNMPSARVGQVTGSTISWGNVGTAASSHAYPSMITAAFSPDVANKFVITHIWGATPRLMVQCGTIDSNNNITWHGAAYSSGMTQPSTTPPHSAAMCFDPSWNSGGGAGAIAWARGEGYGEMATFTLNTNGSIAVGSGQTFTTSGNVYAPNGIDIQCDPNNESKFLVAWTEKEGNRYGKARVVDTSTWPFTDGTIVNFSEDDHVMHPSISWDPNTANKFVVSYTKDWDNTKVCCAKVGNCASGSGTNLTFGTETSYKTGGGFGRVVFNPNIAGAVYIAFRDQPNSDGFVIKGTVTYGSPDTIAFTGTGIEFRDGENLDWEYLSLAFDPFFTGKFYIAHGFRQGSNDTGGSIIVGKPRESKITIDLSTGNYFEVDFQNVSGSINTFTITETLTGTQAQTFYLKVTQGSTARQIEWTSISHIKWPTGPPGNEPPPTISTGNDAVDIFRFTTYDQGTTWHGEKIGQNFS